MKCIKCGKLNPGENQTCVACGSKLPTFAQVPVVAKKPYEEVGAAALAMILEYNGIHIPYEMIVSHIIRDQGGCSAGDVMRAAKLCGLDCKGYQVEPERLETIDLPCILWWDKCNFCVFEGFGDNYAYVVDPMIGRLALTKQELAEHFSGVVLIFEKK